MSEFVCSQCRGKIAETATTCPHCHYNPGAKHARWRKIDGGVAALLILSIVGSPLGLWLLWRARKHAKKSKTARPAVAV